MWLLQCNFFSLSSKERRRKVERVLSLKSGGLGTLYKITAYPKFAVVWFGWFWCCQLFMVDIYDTHLFNFVVYFARYLNLCLLSTCNFLFCLSVAVPAAIHLVLSSEIILTAWAHTDTLTWVCIFMILTLASTEVLTPLCFCGNHGGNTLKEVPAHHNLG